MEKQRSQIAEKDNNKTNGTTQSTGFKVHKFIDFN